MKKKLISTLLAGVMVLGSSTAAFAEEVDMNEDGTVNNPEAVAIQDDAFAFWSLFAGDDGEPDCVIADDSYLSLV